MAPIIVNVDPTTASDVRVDRTQVSSGGAPMLTIGETVQITVRDNPPGGKGTILLGGMLLNAELPSNLVVGDRVTAQVDDEGTQLLFKILTLQRPISIDATIEQMLKNVETLLKDTTLGARLTTAPLQLPEMDAPVMKQLSAMLRQVQSTLLGNADPQAPVLGQSPNQSLELTLQDALSLSNPGRSLGTADNIYQALLSLQRGETSNFLNQLVVALRTAAENAFSSSADRLTSALSTKLANILATESGALDLKQTLLLLTTTLEKELTSGKIADGKARDVLQTALRQLNDAVMNPEAARALLENTLQLLSRGTESSDKTLLDLAQGMKLQQALTQFQQLIQTQTTLNQLNPLMQAIGEPALLLFPFLFHGFLAQSEIVVDPERNKRQKRDKEQQQRRKSKKHSAAPYHQLHVSVPLPYLGQVEVDVAHREKDIYVRFTVPDDEIGKFLLEQLEYLQVLLRKHGFDQAELTAAIGEPRDIRPAWVKGLEGGVSVVV